MTTAKVQKRTCYHCLGKGRVKAEQAYKVCPVCMGLRELSTPVMAETVGSVAMTSPPKTPMELSKERFEAWVRERESGIHPSGFTGQEMECGWEYFSAYMQTAWEGWQAAERDTLERAAKEAARLGAAWRAKSEQEQGYMGNVPNKRNLIGRADGANEIVAAIRRLANG